MAAAMVAAADGETSGGSLGSGSVSSAFAGAGLCVPDVLALMQEKARQAQEEESEAASAADKDKDKTPKKEGGDAADDEEEEDDRATIASEKGQEKKKGRWFDVARAQNTLKRQAGLILDKKTHEARTVKAMLEKEIASVGELPEEDQANYVAEVGIAEGRLKFLEACLQEDAARLNKLVQEVRDGTVSAPSSNYEKLRCCKALAAEMHQKAEAVSSESCVAAAKEEMGAAREPFVLLVAAAKQAGRDIANAKTARQKAAQQKRKLDAAAQAAVQEAPAKRHQAARVSSKPLFTFEVAEVRRVPDHAGDADPAKDPFDFSAPFIVTAPTGTPNPCPVPEAQPELDSFRMRWVGSPERIRHGRGAVSIGDRTISLKLAAFLSGLCRLQPATDELATAAGLSDAVQQALRPGLFAAKEGDAVFNEQEWLACVRYQVSGTRQVIATPALSLAACLPQAAVAQPPATVPFKRRLWSLFFNMGLQAYKAFAAEHPVYCCTVGPRELLYVPAGFVVAENISSAADVIGFRMSLAVPEHPEGAHALEELAKLSGLENAEAVPVGLNALVGLMRKRAPSSRGDSSTGNPGPGADARARADSLTGSAASGSGTCGAHLAPGAAANTEPKTNPEAEAAAGGRAATAGKNTALDQIAIAMAEAAEKAAAAKATAPTKETPKAGAAAPTAAAATASAQKDDDAKAAKAPAAKSAAAKAPAAKAPAVGKQPVFTEEELQASLQSLAAEPAGAAQSAAASSGGRKPRETTKKANK